MGTPRWPSEDTEETEQSRECGGFSSIRLESAFHRSCPAQWIQTQVTNAGYKYKDTDLDLGLNFGFVTDHVDPGKSLYLN